MEPRLEHARETLLRGVDEINKTGIQNQEALCNMEKLIQTYHYIAEIEMLEEFDQEDYERGYERGYGRRGGRRGYGRGYGREGGRRGYGGYERRGYEGYENDGNEVRMFLEESMRNAKTEPERERIRRLMSEY